MHIVYRIPKILATLFKNDVKIIIFFRIKRRALYTSFYSKFYQYVMLYI